MSEPSFYQLAVADGHEGCKDCGANVYWTVIYFEPGSNEATEIGSSWADGEFAQDVCDLMNMAFDAGSEHAKEGKA